MKCLIRAAVACLGACVAASAVAPPGAAAPDDESAPVREGPVRLDANEPGVGRLAPDLPFTDLSGRSGRLSDYRGKPLVICLTSAGCPVARKYAPVLADLERTYRPRGATFLMVNPAAHETPETMRASVAACGFAGLYVPDAEGRFVAALQPRSSTEAFVLDGARTLVYRGAVDDQFGLGYALPRPRRSFLVDALTAVLSETTPETQATTAPGCAVETRAAPAAHSPLTYHNRVSRIVQRSCQDCHRAGETAPFALTSYDDVKGNLATIKRVVKRGVMPPFFADGKAGHWANDRRLPEGDKADLLAWIDAGAPEGDAADAPLPRKFTQGWKIGTPDLVLESPRTFSIPATGALEYQKVGLSTGLAEDRWVSAVEVRPSSPAVVHHVLVFVVYPSDHPRLGEQPRYKNGLDGYFAGLVPGQGHVVFPAGVAKFLPRDAVLIFQIHYTPNGKAVEDRPKIGLVFAKEPPAHELSTRGAFNTKFEIPPGDANFAVTASHVFRRATRLLSFNPHSHVRGKAYRYEMVYPDGRTETVLDVPRYDFNWQLEYFLRDPIDVPAGARLKVTAWYDNSDKNPANPDPAAAVHFGDQTWDEMMIGYFSGYALGK